VGKVNPSGIINSNTADPDSRDSVTRQISNSRKRSSSFFFTKEQVMLPNTHHGILCGFLRETSNYTTGLRNNCVFQLAHGLIA